MNGAGVEGSRGGYADGGRGDALDCRQVFLRLDDYIDRALSPDERAKVGRHLEVCAPCARELGFTAAMIEEIKAKLRRIRAPREVKERLARMLTLHP